ncbi:Gfo/Idh/MocA family protein [Cohnella fermenti]|nr:Gfo/Idh/MocA family oxidoreductase [Cohnella fermenti]
MNIAVIGIGVIGRRHMDNLKRRGDVDIVAVCGTDEGRTASVAAEYGAKPYTDYAVMLRRERIDALFVCTPPGVRKEPIREAAERGIACFVEKPPARTAEEARDIAAIVRDSGIVCSVGFMYRYTGAVSAARERIRGDGGAVPLVRSVHVCGAGLPGATTPRWLYDKDRSGGPLFDQGIHLIDAARYAAGLDVADGGEAVGIHAFGSNVQRPRSEEYTVEDNVVVQIAYTSGTLHTHTHSWGVADSQAKIELLGSDYRLIVDLTRLGSRLFGTFKGEELDERFPEENMYAAEADAFLSAARTGEPSGIRSPYADAARSLELVVNGGRSLEEGCSLRL